MKLIYSDIQKGKGEHAANAVRERRWDTPLADGIKLIGRKVALAVSSVCLLGALTFGCSSSDKTANMIVMDGKNYTSDVRTQDSEQKDGKSKIDSTRWDTGADAPDMSVVNDTVEQKDSMDDGAVRPDTKKDAVKDILEDVAPDTGPDAGPDTASDVQKELAADADGKTDAQANETGIQETIADTAEESIAPDTDAVNLTDSMFVDVPVLPVDAQDAADGETVDTGPFDTNAQELADTNETAPTDAATEIAADTLDVAAETIQDTETVQPPWYGSEWSACTDITIVGEVPENYSHRLVLGPAEVDKLLTADAVDMQFYEGTCDNPNTEVGKLSHWIEGFNASGNLVVWVKTKTTNVTGITMVTSNPNATDTSDISNAFLFGDGFDGTELDPAKWIAHSWFGSLKMSFSDGKMNVDGYPTGYNHLESTVNSTSTESLAIMIKFKMLEDGQMGPATMTHGHFIGKADDKVLVTLYLNKLMLHRYLSNKWLEIAPVPISASPNEWYLQTHTWDENTHYAKLFKYANGQELAAVSGTCTEITQGKIGIEFDMVKALVDWFAVRKAIANEPVYLMGP